MNKKEGKRRERGNKKVVRIKMVGRRRERGNPRNKKVVKIKMVERRREKGNKKEEIRNVKKEIKKVAVKREGNLKIKTEVRRNVNPDLKLPRRAREVRNLRNKELTVKHNY